MLGPRHTKARMLTFSSLCTSVLSATATNTAQSLTGFISARPHLLPSPSAMLRRSRRPITSREAARYLLRAPRDSRRDAAFRRAIRQIPRGKVATYGQVAAAAGYPLYHRQVAQLLRSSPVGSLPWQRVLGSGGAIKLRGEAAFEQHMRLEMEGVRFRGKRVDMEAHQHHFRLWELDD